MLFVFFRVVVTQSAVFVLVVIVTVRYLSFFLRIAVTQSAVLVPVLVVLVVPVTVRYL